MTGNYGREMLDEGQQKSLSGLKPGMLHYMVGSLNLCATRTPHHHSFTLQTNKELYYYFIYPLSFYEQTAPSLRPMEVRSL